MKWYTHRRLLGGELNGEGQCDLGKLEGVLGGELVQGVGRGVDRGVVLVEGRLEREGGRVARLGPARVVAARVVVVWFECSNAMRVRCWAVRGYLQA